MFRRKKRRDRNVGSSSGVAWNQSLTVQDQLGVSFESQMKPYDPQYDLSTRKHNDLIGALKAKLPYKVKEVRRFPVKIVEQDITNMCVRVLHQIQGDISIFRLQIEQGKTYFEGKLKTFNKEALIKKYTEEFQNADAEGIHKAENVLTEYVKAQKAKRHLLLEELNHLKHEANDYLYEQYKGKSPKRHWYNS